jgi:hypothetical protein
MAEMHNYTMKACRELAAQAWTTPRTKMKVMDVVLAETFAEILFRAQTKGIGLKHERPMTVFDAFKQSIQQDKDSAISIGQTLILCACEEGVHLEIAKALTIKFMKSLFEVDIGQQ